ncbi:alpha-N-arabinofuranosidase [Arthrobacter castelli]|uniref:arabinosylfuranosidase ArfA n=1 Tax=Arthrobacter castelli TaxID=271431 RepID=UPI0003FADA08|nr:alpha-N-arabinofuranosidase [Arthrobacter castelli]
MPSASITLDPAFRTGEVPRRLFGSFVEHMGRSIYEGIYEPSHPKADDDGLRRDVVELVRELGPTVVRYPGGNFVSNYRWEDGVGPQAERPRRLDLAWRSIESNQFGLSEFMRWAKLADVEPMMAVNLGTRGVQEALDLLEYSNHPGGTALSDLRIKHGDADPYDVKLWCLGNELDGPWQVGHKSALEYGRLAAETGRAMKLVDPSIELVACGSSNSSMPTFGSWEQTVLREAYDYVDYISLHAYYEERDGDVESFLASALDMDHFIESVVSTADAIGAELGNRKRINLSFDEWNVWYQSKFHASDIAVGRSEWVEHPRVIEDEYNVTDAVVVGTLLNSLLRHGDRVTVACQAQLVNVIAPIRSEPGSDSWRQTIFHPFAQMAGRATGSVLQLAVSSDSYESEKFGTAPLLDASATWDAESRRLTLFAANRGLDDALDLAVDLRSLDPAGTDGRIEDALTLAVADDGSRFTANDQQRPDSVGMIPLSNVVVDSGTLKAELPPLSWSVIALDFQ